jgi:hypothetical protein
MIREDQERLEPDPGSPLEESQHYGGQVSFSLGDQPLTWLLVSFREQKATGTVLRVFRTSKVGRS